MFSSLKFKKQVHRRASVSNVVASNGLRAYFIGRHVIACLLASMSC